MLLADFAQTVAGKLYVMGGGWSVTGPGPSPMAIAAKIDIPWEEANKRHEFRLELIDEDGQLVSLPGPAGPQPFVFNAHFEAGRPPGIAPGTPLDMPFSVSIGPTQLEPGRRYAFRLSVLGTPASQTCTFSVRSQLPQA